ncbi:hypothetical protein [Thalassotalea atypica]|uniref:hypothetical protein n=1 Tax=Thalassotalea atypica TaxID=2054316 RepID=UPI002573F0C2|nr:hypothetical protein [Thalassotalea atypica]
MKQLTSIIGILCCSALLSGHSMADTLQFKDGQQLEGHVISLNTSTLTFEIAGQQLAIERVKVASVAFSASNQSASTTPDHTAKAESLNNQIDTDKQSNSGKQTTLPAGTGLLVKTLTTIDSNKHTTGHKFVTKLDANIEIDDQVIIPAGTPVYGQIQAAKQSHRLAGNAAMDIRFTHLKLNHTLVEIQSSAINVVSDSTTKQSIGRTARLAAIGGLANGSKGAENAAKAGLGLSMLSSGNAINIPAGTLLEFKLTAATPITLS